MRVLPQRAQSRRHRHAGEAAEPVEVAEVVDKPLQVGDPAPAFSLPGSDGKTYDLADLSGRGVVVAWFPKAFTGG